MYDLVKVESAGHWRALHQIRRETLFDTGIFPFIYDENRPGDRQIGNTPYLLLLNGNPVGVVRLDIRDVVCIVRLVGISEAFQQQGHGRALSGLIEEKVAAHGISELRVNAFKDAIGFYEKMGWFQQTWDPVELCSLAPGNVQMVKTVQQI